MRFGQLASFSTLMADQLVRLSLAPEFMSSIRLVKRFTFKIIGKFPLLYLELGLTI
jgi:hypothetical protein